MRSIAVFVVVLLSLVACQQQTAEAEQAAPMPFAMPTLVGQPLEAARDICAQWEMELAVMEERLEHRKDEGTVLSQWPKPGEDSVAGRTAVVVVAKKPERVRIPRLHNLTITQAEQKLAAVGLRIDPRKCYRYDGSVPKDHLLDYDPGKEVFAGSDVQIIISKGPVPRGGGEVNTMRLGE